MSDKQRSTSQVRGKHTLGPWKAIGDKIYSADQRQVAHVYALVHPDDLNVMQSIPNAKLLAAAPTLLEELDELVGHLQYMLGSNDLEKYRNELKDTVEYSCELLNKLFTHD